MPNDGMSLAGLDRPAMERARLERLQKKRSASEALGSDSLSNPRHDKHMKAEPSKSDAQSQLGLASASQHNQQLYFPRGVVKLTWCLGFPRANDLKIEEVLERKTLKIAVLSSWQIDTEWLFSKIDLPKTKTILVMQSKDAKEQKAWTEDSRHLSKSLRLCFPPMRHGQFGTMHSKLMLLFHDSHLRICVPSANLVSFDWGESGVMENVMWLIDLPRLKEVPASNTTPFAEDLISFCQAMDIDKCFSDQHETLTEGLKRFDFSQTNHVRLVHTIPAPRFGDAASTTGFPLLANAARALLPKPFHSPKVHYAVSSVGSITKERVATMYEAIQGKSIPLPDGKRHTSISEAQTYTGTAACSAFGVYYPSRSTIQCSKGKLSASGTLFMTPNFDKACDTGTFPLESLRDLISQRQGLLSHCKMILAQTDDQSLTYIGSANFSPSAWGTLSWDKKEKQPKFSANNWELGVLLLGTSRSGKPYELDGTPIPVPFEIPGPLYVQEGHPTRRPHMQSLG